MTRKGERRPAGLKSLRSGPGQKKDKGWGVRVGLKYCGGCNPRYDRVALAEDLKARVGQGIEWVSPESGDLNLVLAIEGCETACADLSLFSGIVIRVITCPEDAESFLLEMKGDEGI